MKIKTSELIGAALDWAVAQCEGVEYRYLKSTGGDYNSNWWWETLNYSTDWAQGGLIIDKKRINLMYCHPESSAAKEGILCVAHRDGNYLGGPSGLVAAMRCFVASKLGEEVEVPEELV